MSLQSTLPLRIDGRQNGTSPLASSGLLGTLLSSPLHECQISERKKGGGECNATEMVRNRSRFVPSVYMMFWELSPIVSPLIFLIDLPAIQWVVILHRSTR